MMKRTLIMFFLRTPSYLLAILAIHIVFAGVSMGQTMVFNTEIGSPIKHASGLQVHSNLAKCFPSPGENFAESKKRHRFQLSTTVTNTGTDEIVISGWQFEAICPEDSVGREWDTHSFVLLTAPTITAPFTLKPGENKTWLCSETDFYQCRPKSGVLEDCPEYMRANIDAVVLEKNSGFSKEQIAGSQGGSGINGKTKLDDVDQVSSVNKNQQKKELKSNSVTTASLAKGIQAGVYDTPLWDYPISIRFAENGNLIYKDYREKIEYQKTSENKFIHPTSPNVYIEASGQNKLINAESTSRFKREFTLYSPYNATPAKGVMSFLKDGDKYYAVPCNDAMFTGVYKDRYESKTMPTYQLNGDQSGVVQTPQFPPNPFTWWIESDYKGNIQKVDGALAYRFVLVRKFSDGTFQRSFFDVWKDGSQATIYDGIKKGQINVNSNPCPPSPSATEELNGDNQSDYVHPNPSPKKPVQNPYSKPVPTNTSTKTDVTAIPVPEYLKEMSIPFRYSAFQPSFNGMYVGFYPKTVSVTDPSQSNVFKLHGTSWIKSHHNRNIFCYDAERHMYEQNEELTFQWAGALTKDEQTKLENSGKKIPKANQKIGLHTQTNSSNTPSTENRKFQKFFQIVSAPSILTQDKNYYPTLFGIGPDYETSNNKIYCWVESRTDINGYTPVDLGLTTADLGALCMAASDEDSYVWIGSGQKIIKVTSSENTDLIDLGQVGAKGSITKMIVNQGELWILCGSQIFKKSGANVSLFHTASYNLSSFAVDNSMVYTSDGNKISKGIHKVTPLFGAAPLIPSKINDFNRAKSELPNCLIETSLDATDRFLYLFSPFSGTVYKIEK